MNMLDFSGLQQPPPPQYLTDMGHENQLHQKSSRKNLHVAKLGRSRRKGPIPKAWMMFGWLFCSLINFHHDVIVVFFFFKLKHHHENSSIERHKIMFKDFFPIIIKKQFVYIMLTFCLSTRMNCPINTPPMPPPPGNRAFIRPKRGDSDG